MGRELNDQLLDGGASPGLAQAIYLDHQATTPVDPRVSQVILSTMTEQFGNPNSVDHSFGGEAARIIDGAVGAIADLVGAGPGDVRLTGSATEALRLVIGLEMNFAQGPFGVAASRIEHPAVIDLLNAAERKGYLSVDWIDCDGDALVPLQAVMTALERRPALLFLMAANNEVGTLQPTVEAAALARAAGAAIVVDASQAAGRILLDTDAAGFDYMILSSHKLYGPKGAGALIGPGLRDVASPFPLEAHAPTPNTPAIAGFGEACRLRRLEMTADEPRIAALRDRLADRLASLEPGMTVNGALNPRLACNLHVSFEGAPNDQVIAQLRNTVAVSTGAACASGADAPSHVLSAMGLPSWRQQTALRIGVGKFTTAAEIDRAAEMIATAVQLVRKRAHR